MVDERSKKTGMTTEELKAFTEITTTLRISVEGLRDVVTSMSQDVKAMRKENNDRFDRIESRWDDRLRIVEKAATTNSTNIENLKGDVDDLQGKSNLWDGVIGFISAIGIVLGVIFGNKQI